MSANRIVELAGDYLSDKFTQSPCDDYEEFLAELRDLFIKNAGHIGDCFTDTSDWVEGELFAQDVFEAEIVRQVFAAGM